MNDIDKEIKDPFWYQLTNPQSLNGLASVINTLKDSGKVKGEDFVIKEHPTKNALKPKFSVYTQGKTFSTKYSHGDIMDNYSNKDFIF